MNGFEIILIITVELVALISPLYYKIGKIEGHLNRRRCKRK